MKFLLYLNFSKIKDGSTQKDCKVHLVEVGIKITKKGGQPGTSEINQMYGHPMHVQLLRLW